MIENAKMEWTSEDVESFRQFIENTKAGQKLLSALSETIPGLLSGGDINAILIRSGEVRGHTESVRNLFAMAYPAPVGSIKSAEAYPALTDDTQWNDNQKIDAP